MNWFTKGKVLFLSFLFLILYCISYLSYSWNFPLWYQNFCCVDDITLNLFLIFIPIFVLNLFTSIKSFKIWLKFTFLFLLIYFFIYLTAPSSSGGFLWLQKEAISLFGSILYSLISLGIIIYKSIKKS